MWLFDLFNKSISFVNKLNSPKLSRNFLYENNVCGTLTSKKDCYCLFDEPRYTTDFEAKCIGSYPQDYDFCGNKPEYLIGMSVPPVMTAQIATRIYEQWLSKINEL